MDNSGPDPKEVQHAKELCEDLLANVREQYEEFKTRPPQRYGGGGGGERGGYGGGDRGGYGGGYGGNSYGGDRGRENSYGGSGYGGYGNSPAPATSGQGSPAPQAAPGAAASNPQDYAAQYAQYYQQTGQADPYAAYGGYAASVVIALEKKCIANSIQICPVLPAVYGGRPSRSTAGATAITISTWSSRFRSSTPTSKRRSSATTIWTTWNDWRL
jgi:hypothetical protein